MESSRVETENMSSLVELSRVEIEKMSSLVESSRGVEHVESSQVEAEIMSRQRRCRVKSSLGRKTLSGVESRQKNVESSLVEVEKMSSKVESEVEKLSNRLESRGEKCLVESSQGGKNVE